MFGGVFYYDHPLTIMKFFQNILWKGIFFKQFYNCHRVVIIKDKHPQTCCFENKPIKRFVAQGYGLAWYSHFTIEMNKPATWQVKMSMSSMLSQQTLQHTFSLASLPFSRIWLGIVKLQSIVWLKIIKDFFFNLEAF